MTEITCVQNPVLNMSLTFLTQVEAVGVFESLRKIGEELVDEMCYYYLLGSVVALFSLLLF